jgi:hypothetical protein
VDGQVTAVLGVPPVRSALKAVQASILADEPEARTPSSIVDSLKTWGIRRYVSI